MSLSSNGEYISPRGPFDTSGIRADPQGVEAMYGILSDLTDGQAAFRETAGTATVSGLRLIRIPASDDSDFHIYPTNTSILENPHDHTFELRTVVVTGEGWRQVVDNFRPYHPNRQVPKGVNVEPWRRVANTRVRLSDGGVHYVQTDLEEEVPLEMLRPNIKGPVAGETIALGAIHRVAVQKTDPATKPKGSVVSLVRRTKKAPSSHSDTPEGLMSSHSLTDREADIVMLGREQIAHDIDAGRYPVGTELGPTTIVYLKPGERIRQIEKPARGPDGFANSEEVCDFALEKLEYALETLREVVFGNLDYEEDQ